MKFETKLKIIHWVEKLLKMEPVAQPLIIREERTIQVARHQHIYGKEELEWIKKHSSYGYLASHEIARLLLKQNAIKFTEEPYLDLYAQEGVTKIRVTAELRFIMP